MEIEIRKATIKDFGAIQDLNYKLFIKEYNEYDKKLNCQWPFQEIGTKYYKERISKNGCVLVALIKGKIVAYIIGALAEPENYRIIKKMAELENMHVLEEYRGKGIGTKLVNDFFKWCHEKGVTVVKVSASAPNSQGIKFYRKLGFNDYSLILERSMDT